MNDFLATKKLFNKEDGVQYYYAIQSFEEGVKINPFTAHLMARELVERCYPDHQVLIATHTDTDNIHSHIIINSVNMKSGIKVHQNKNDLLRMRDINDDICKKHGVPICAPVKKSVKPMKQNEYYSASEGRSWKFHLIVSIERAMKKAKTKEQFIKQMNSSGYDVLWTDSRKYITYTEITNPKHKCRDNNMHEEKFLKSNMEEEFEQRRLATTQEEKREVHRRNGTSNESYHSGKSILAVDDRHDEELGQDNGGNTNPNFKDDRHRADEERNTKPAGYGRNAENGFEGYDENASVINGEYDVKTGWEDEREYAFGNKGNESTISKNEEQTHTNTHWKYNLSTNNWYYGISFAGNLFEMINTNQKSNRKRFKLSNKSIQKKKAQGQKSSNYEEYDDYTLSM